MDRRPAGGGRGVVRCFVGREVHDAVEACTGWLFVANALAAAGVVGASGRADVRTWPSSGPPNTARERLGLTLVLAYCTRTGTPGSPWAPTLRTIQLIALFDRRMQP